MISGFSQGALQQLSERIGGSIVVLDFGPLTVAIEHVRGQLRSIDEAIRNPEATAGDEKYRKGELAFVNGWWDDALEELLASISMHRYRARPHLLCGLTYLHLGNTPAALDELVDAAKYGRAEEPRSGITAALLAALLYDAVGQRDAAVDLLREAETLGPSIVLSAALQARDPSADHANDLVRLLESQQSREWSSYRPLIAQAEDERRQELASAIESIWVASETATSALRAATNHIARSYRYSDVPTSAYDPVKLESPYQESTLGRMLDRVATGSPTLSPISVLDETFSRRPDVDSLDITSLRELGARMGSYCELLHERLRKDVIAAQFSNRRWSEALAHAVWKRDKRAAQQRVEGTANYLKANASTLASAQDDCANAAAAWEAVAPVREPLPTTEPLFAVPTTLSRLPG